MALLVGTTQIYQLAYALVGLLLVALVLGLFFSRGLWYARRISEGERPTVGRSSHVELIVSNASRTRSPNVEVVDHLPERHPFRGLPLGGFETRKVREPVLFAYDPVAVAPIWRMSHCRLASGSGVTSRPPRGREPVRPAG